MASTDNLAAQAYKQASSGNISLGGGGDFASAFLAAAGQGSASGSFPTTPSTSPVLNQSLRQSDLVYVEAPSLRYGYGNTVEQAGLNGDIVKPSVVSERGGVSPTAAASEAVFNAFLRGDDSDITKTQRKLVAAGYLPQGSFIPGVADDATKQAYQQLLADGADYAAAGKKKTLEEILRERARLIEREAKDPNSPFFSGTKTQTSTDTRVDLTSPTQARMYAEQSLGDLLGRMPTQQEFEAYKAALNSEERAHPTTSTSTTTTQYQRGQAQSSNTNTVVNSGSTDPSAVAESYAYQHDGGEVAQMGLLKLLGAFQNLIGGGQ